MERAGSKPVIFLFWIVFLICRKRNASEVTNMITVHNCGESLPLYYLWITGVLIFLLTEIRRRSKMNRMGMLIPNYLYYDTESLF